MIGCGFVDVDDAVLPGGGQILKAGKHSLRRSGLHKLDAYNLQASPVPVHRLLQRLLDARFDLRLAVCQGIVDGVLSHDLPDTGGGAGLQQGFGVADIQQIVRTVFYLVMDRQVHIDQVGIPGQQLLHASLYLAHILRLHQRHRFDGCGELIVDAWCNGVIDHASETADNAALVHLHHIDAGEQPGARQYAAYPGIELFASGESMMVVAVFGAGVLLRMEQQMEVGR